MQLLLWIQVLIVTSASTLIRPQQSRRAAFTLDDVSQTLDSLERLLQYFDNNRGSLIVDSMWAIRMIQGWSIYIATDYLLSCWVNEYTIFLSN